MARRWWALAALAGAVLGDIGSYGLGRFAAERIPPRMRASPLQTRSAALFTRWGLLGLYLTRFLLTPIRSQQRRKAAHRREDLNLPRSASCGNVEFTLTGCRPSSRARAAASQAVAECV